MIPWRKGGYIALVVVGYFAIAGASTRHVYMTLCVEHESARRELAQLSGIFWPAVMPFYLALGLPCKPVPQKASEP